MSARTAEAPPPSDTPAAEPAAAPLVSLDSLVMKNVQVALRAKLGDVEMSVEELLALKAGAILKLNRPLGEPVDLYLNDALVARGEIVAVDDNFGIRLLEVAKG
jgi:flagellar motor switch protein FliN/FliY